MTRDVYMDGIVYALGDEPSTVERAAERGWITSSAEDLRRAGFARHHVCATSTTAYDLARRTAEQLGDRLDEVDVVIHATCLPQHAQLADGTRFAATRDVKHLMDFAASRLQAELELGHATVIGLTQQACTGVLGAVRIGAALLRDEPALRRVLCITADRFPEGAFYEQAYSLISDGGAACVIGREPAAFRVLASHAITNGALAQASDDETVGAYFSYTHRLVRETLAKASLDVRDLAWIVPQNMNATAWTILARVLGIDRARIAQGTLADVAHVISADNLINLRHLDAEGRLEPGDRILLVMAGYGMHWQSLLLEKR